MTLVELFKNAFRPKSDLALAVAELEEAKRSRLQAQSAQEYAMSMVAYHASRIERLSNYIALQDNQPKDWK
jgi:hypothetical protein